MRTRWLLVVGLLCLWTMRAEAQDTKLFGFCENGSPSVTIPGTQGSGAQKVQQSYPGATVSVFNQGTVVLATIFADSIGTAKANPFTCSMTGQWFFYGVPGTHYDVQFSGGGIPTPFTIGDQIATGSLSSTGTISNIAEFASSTSLINSPLFVDGSNQILYNGTSTDITGSHILTIGNNTGFEAVGATTNASTATLTITNGTSATVTSGRSSGSGTFLPLAFNVNGGEVARFSRATNLDGSLLLNNTTTDLNLNGTPSMVTIGNNTGFVTAGATTNASVMSLGVTNGSYISLSANRTGAGTFLPIAFFTSSTQQMTLGVNGGLAIGTPTGGAGSTGQINAAGAYFANNVGVISSAGDLTGLTYKTQTNCSSSGGTCAAAPTGSVSIAAAATTVTVNTTAVTANSNITITFDESLGAKLGVTCNSAAASENATYFISARSSGTSFTVKTNTAPTTNPACLNYLIVN